MFSQSHRTRTISCHSYNLNITWEIRSYKYILHLHIYTYTEIISTLEPQLQHQPSSHTPGPSFAFEKGPSITFIQRHDTEQLWSELWSGPGCICCTLHSLLLGDSSLERSIYKYSSGLKMHFYYPTAELRRDHSLLGYSL